MPITTAGSARKILTVALARKQARQKDARFIGLGGACAILIYLAVHHDDLPGGVAHNDRIVSRRYNGRTLLLIELPHTKQFRRGLRIQIRGRLIGEQQHWIGDNGSSNGDTLLLATRQLCQGVDHQDLPDPNFAARCWHAPAAPGQAHPVAAR